MGTLDLREIISIENRQSSIDWGKNQMIVVDFDGKECEHDTFIDSKVLSEKESVYLLS